MDSTLVEREVVGQQRRVIELICALLGRAPVGELQHAPPGDERVRAHQLRREKLDLPQQLHEQLEGVACTMLMAACTTACLDRVLVGGMYQQTCETTLGGAVSTGW